MKLQGKVALITGASQGLGLQIAKLYAQRGARLVVAARRKEMLDVAVKELEPQTEVLALALDVSEDAEGLVEAGLRRFGRIDVLLNNASEIGPSPMPPLESYPWYEL